tara:strand:+ start:398 stop:862 length:465 start_codon:yes stop_codon:yes gene_type:complete
MSTIDRKILKLIKKNLSISIAESCTGGLIASSITKIDGASKIFSCGIVSYSNDTKVRYLSVSKKTLRKFGAVSSNVATEMVNGLFKKEKTKITISTTGIAGPNGGSKKKPVGLVYIGIKFKKKNYIYKNIFKGSRFEIQKKTTNFVFKKIEELI